MPQTQPYYPAAGRLGYTKAMACWPIVGNLTRRNMMEAVGDTRARLTLRPINMGKKLHRSRPPARYHTDAWSETWGYVGGIAPPTASSPMTCG